VLRLVDIQEKTSSNIVFSSPEVYVDDVLTYVIYDTSTGITAFDDYITWRTPTGTTDGVDDKTYTINDSNLFPSYQSGVDYSNLSDRLLYTMSFSELTILQHVLTRIDSIRKRLPNPSYSIDSTNAVGQDGTVSMAGGFDKKFSIQELMQMIEGSIAEINWTSPKTNFWPIFMTHDEERKTSPYLKNSGVPFDMFDLVVQGAVLRAMVAWGILEIDLSFNVSDSGLNISFDRVGAITGFRGSLLTEYNEQKGQFKWKYANHAGVGVGTIPYSMQGLLGIALNNVASNGSLAMSSLLGWQVHKPI